MQNVEWVMGDTPQTITTTRASCGAKKQGKEANGEKMALFSL